MDIISPSDSHHETRDDKCYQDNTRWIDVSGRNEPEKEKVDTGYPKPEIPEFSLQSLDFTSLLIGFAKWFGLFMVLFLIGRWRFSFIWIALIACLVSWLWNQRKARQTNRETFKNLNDEKLEKTQIMKNLHELPSWVFFPDVERAEWLNKIILQMWPFINNYLKSMIKNQIEPQVKAKLPAVIKTFRFETIDVGDIPVRIGGIKVYQERLNRDEIIMDMEIFYAGDCEFTLNVNGIKSGVKNVTFHGNIRVHIYPLISDIPFVGALKVFLLNRPAIDFDLTNLANALDFPGISDLLRKVMMDVVASMIVIPNKFGLILSKDIESQQIKYFIPKGVVRITLFSAHNLVNADISLLGRKSDPYAKITVGAKEFRTSIVNNNLNPIWNEAFEAIVDEPFGQRLEISVMDHDPNKDDFLGRMSLDMESIMKQGLIDSNFNLEDAKHGDLHARVEWLKPIAPITIGQIKDPLSKTVKTEEISTRGDQDKKAEIKRKQPSPRDMRDSYSESFERRPNEDNVSLNDQKLVETNKNQSLAILKDELILIENEYLRRGIRGSLSTAILVIFVDSAKNLPFPLDIAAEPNPQAILSIVGGEGVMSNASNKGDIKNTNVINKVINSEQSGYKTQAKPKTTNPVWEQCFTLLVNNPTLATLNIEVKDEKSGKSLGSMTYPVGKLLDEAHFDKKQSFPLTSKGYNDAQIVLIMSLRMLRSGPDPLAFKKGELAQQLEHDPGLRGLVATGNAARQPSAGPVDGSYTDQSADEESFGPNYALAGNDYYARGPPGIYYDEQGRRHNSLMEQNGDDIRMYGAIGGAPIPIMPAPPMGVDLTPRDGNLFIHPSADQEYLKHRGPVGPRVLMNFFYDDPQHKFIILLERVENLNIHGDLSNASPYVKFEMLPTTGFKESPKRKSVVIKNSLNPTFNERFEWSIPKEEIPFKRIQVTVKNEGGFLKADTTLGQSEIDLSQIELNEPRSLWYCMKKFPVKHKWKRKLSYISAQFPPYANSIQIS